MSDKKLNLVSNPDLDNFLYEALDSGALLKLNEKDKRLTATLGKGSDQIKLTFLDDFKMKGRPELQQVVAVQTDTLEFVPASEFKLVAEESEE